MINKHLIPLIIVILCCLACKTNQNREFKYGLEQSENLNYSLAIQHFLNSWRASPNSETVRNLAENYMKVRDFEQAEEWYGKLQRDSNLLNSDYLPFSQALIANSKYEEANALLNLLSSVDSSEINLAIIRQIKNIAASGKLLMNKSSNVNIIPLSSINSSASDFGPFLDSENNLFFTSDRLDGGGKVDPTNALKSEIYGWTGNGFLKMFETKWNSDKNDIEGDLFQPGNLESRYHIGPIYKAKNKLFITLTKNQKFNKTNKKSNSRDFTLFPEIYYAQYSDSVSIEDFIPLSFNNAFAYSVSDPFFDQESGRLYFSSDMPGGFGGADIYYSQLSGDSIWSQPINLGAQINSRHDERSPFLFMDHLYFSSNGWGGLGGLDVFKVSRQKDSFGPLENMGYPLNSSRDDFGFFINSADKNEAFLASDRLGGKGLDDLYFANLDLRKFMTFRGKVLDKKTNEPLPDAVVFLLSSHDQGQTTFISEKDGMFSFRVPLNRTISLRAEKTGYISKTFHNIYIPNNSDIGDSVMVQNILLDQIQVGRVYGLKNIYYDFDKWYIRPDAEPDLLYLTQIMKENPTLTIELYSHTDSRGSKNYNLKLSQKRANSAVQFLIKQGISGNRIKGIGFGEERLINHCLDGTICTEKEHQQNRRTEFRIISY